MAKPDGLLLVPPGGELEFLHPLPVRRLWGVGAVTAAKLHALGIHTVGEVAGVGEAALVSILGAAGGRHLHALAHNRDPRPVQVGRRRRSIGSQRALGRSPRSLEAIEAALIGLVDRVTGRCGQRAGSGAPSSSGSASATSLAQADRTRCPSRPRRPPRSSPSPERCWRPRCR